MAAQARAPTGGRFNLKVHERRHPYQIPIRKRMNKPGDGIWIIDAEAKTLYANDAMAEILGTEASRLIGEHSFKYVFPEDVSSAQRLF
jgi:PAS domain-containing protein